VHKLTAGISDNLYLQNIIKHPKVLQRNFVTKYRVTLGVSELRGKIPDSGSSRSTTGPTAQSAPISAQESSTTPHTVQSLIGVGDFNENL